ncbi:MAG TPA: glycosyltransferase family 1 protein [Longimicrobiales bacterium]|nr:glycosyltransferase family 1 protein [Longimicrobiales bacterium]
MKVVYFTESLLPLVDGVSHTLNHLFLSLEDAGIEFRVYAPFKPPGDVRWAGRVHKVRSFRFPLYRDYKVSIPGGRRLVAELDDFEPDLIHVASPTPMAVWAQNYARSRDIPVVATFHTHFVSYFPYYRLRGLEPLGWRMIRWFYGRCDATYAPSSSIVDELRAHGLEGVRLWSRGVDASLFSPEHRDDELRAQVGADEDSPMVLMVSRLVKEKDMTDLVDMDAELRRRGLRYRLALVGTGPMRRELEQKLPDAHFAGHQRGQALARWYASGDVFVFPSTTETFANVVQEAMASGVPAVVVDRGGPPGVIEPGRSGLVARANDGASLADQVERLLRDPALRAAMGLAARKRAAARTWDAVNDVLITDYQRVTRAAAATVRRSA